MKRDEENSTFPGGGCELGFQKAEDIASGTVCLQQLVLAIEHAEEKVLKSRLTGHPPHSALGSRQDTVVIAY